MDLSVKITGDKELQRVFANMPRATQRKALRPAGRAGATTLMNLATANLKQVIEPGSTGVGEKSLKVYALKKYRGSMRFGVQVRRGMVNTRKLIKGVPVRVGLYLSVLEYGKKNQPPRSWLRKAAREGVGQVLASVRTEFASRINDAVRDAKS